MRLEKQESAGGAGAGADSIWKREHEHHQSHKTFTSKSTALPFGQPIAFKDISGPTYVTAQTLAQQIAYSLSDKIYSYSPETFDLDVSVKDWARSQTANAYGNTTAVSALQSRTGAGALALGYMFSKDFDASRRHVPHSVLGSAGSLIQLRSTLSQLSAVYDKANPFVAHITAVDYAAASASGLVSDYTSALTIAEDLGLGLVASASPYETQHMSLLSTLLASVLPTVHIYDGLKVGRDTVRVIDTLDQSGLKKTYEAVSKQIEALNKKADAGEKVTAALSAFNAELGTDYKLFEYHGHEAAETVLVVFGTVEAALASQVANKLAAGGAKVGVVNVRVYRPFVEESFLAALPASAQTVAVLGQVQDATAVADKSVHSTLFGDVAAALTFSDKFSASLSIVDSKYAREQSFTPADIADIFAQVDSKAIADAEEQIQLLAPGKAEQYIFWDLDESAAASAPVAVSKILSGDSSDNVFLKQAYDNFVQGGVIRSDIRSSKKSIDTSYAIEEADVAFVGSEKILKDVDVLKSLKSGGKLMVKLAGFKEEDLEKKLSAVLRREIQAKGVELYVLDPSLVAAVEADAELEQQAVELAFLSLAKPEVLAKGVEKLAALVGTTTDLAAIAADIEKALRQIEVPATWAELEAESETKPLLASVQTSSFVAFDKSDAEEPALLKDWVSAAKGLIFKEAYETKQSLRPDLSVKTFTVKVQENRRLTPQTYDRNIFHIEFDLGTSGLTYNIGEALGIHAQNDAAEVEEFIRVYGLNADDVVEVPSREDWAVLETRTVYQSLMQNIDIFGKPPKKFYEALAEFATDENEKKDLLTLAGPEGATEFKRRAEVDTVTYADILLEYPSAHPSFHDIAQIVSPMKRREYSIASSQKVGPTSVALMIVVVNWVDPKGRDRFGQATRYLSRLPVGAAVTVSVKPSVMKLPASDKAPLIMAGLGTGLAPFRAFVQYRAMQKAAGVEIGEILLYMGSRHQREEYLYGEEWEAYVDAGVITLLGTAFSRDQKDKIYIQDRMRQTVDQIIAAYIENEGSFYLCGPTWPVPDVTEVLEEAIKRHGKNTGKKVDSKKEIERLKEAERYVLEVY
jgi:sulfite reductase (NADPH) flavoprotein alpha-component